MITKTTAIPAKLQTIIDDAEQLGLVVVTIEHFGNGVDQWSVGIERPRRPIRSMLDVIEMSECFHIVATKGKWSGARWSMTARRINQSGPTKPVLLKGIPFQLRLLSNTI